MGKSRKFSRLYPRIHGVEKAVIGREQRQPARPLVMALFDDSGQKINYSALVSEQRGGLNAPLPPVIACVEIYTSEIGAEGEGYENLSRRLFRCYSIRAAYAQLMSLRLGGRYSERDIGRLLSALRRLAGNHATDATKAAKRRLKRKRRKRRNRRRKKQLYSKL